MKEKVVHLHFKEPVEGSADLYFGSFKAIYDLYPSEAIGITYKALVNAIHGRDCYENKKVKIRVSEYIRKPKTKAKDKPC